jgi:hypothetical protein
MKNGEAGFRHSRAPNRVHPVVAPVDRSGPPLASKTGLSKRAQRRFEESEERRRLRKEKKRKREA